MFQSPISAIGGIVTEASLRPYHSAASQSNFSGADRPGRARCEAPHPDAPQACGHGPLGAFTSGFAAPAGLPAPARRRGRRGCDRQRRSTDRSRRATSVRTAASGIGPGISWPPAWPTRRHRRPSQSRTRSNRVRIEFNIPGGQPQQRRSRARRSRALGVAAVTSRASGMARRYPCADRLRKIAAVMVQPEAQGT